MSELPFTTNYLSKIETLPLILAGPILRHTEPTSVTVWLALKEARSLQLEIYATKDRGATIDRLLFKGRRDTVRLGKYLHLVAITAKTSDDLLLQAGEIYAYNIYCDRRNSLFDFQHSDLSYFDHQLPTFSLPPEDLNRLNIVHGSCRKPHGGGKDALSCLDKLIKNAASIANDRPHQVFLTGDQIYSDDVADPMLWLAQETNNLLFGWSEELPLKEGSILAEELPPGKRSEIARIEGGFTGMFRGNANKAKSHLFSFSEYASVYLLSWSPNLIPSSFPDARSLFKDPKRIAKWQQEIDDIHSFIDNLPEVRRALANVPIYTICDDHEISDDWYLNREWCDRVLGKPLGKRVIQNGLLAYALFQAWGNTPQHFAPGTAGEKLLKSAHRWLTSQGKDLSAKRECDLYLGIPQNDPQTGLPQLELDGEMSILSRDSQAIPWHYAIDGNKHEVIVLDTRNWRGYPQGKEAGLEPPMLLCPQAFEEQLNKALARPKPETEITLVVLPTNLVALGIIDRIQQFELSRDRVFSSDVGDSWNIRNDAFAQLLLNFCRQRKQVIVLSGDIHYSCAVKLTHWFHDSLEASVVVQLTSSAIKNSELATRIAHTKIKSLLPEQTKRWVGWNRPLKIKEIERFLGWHKRHNSNKNLPDWQYKIEWCKRQPATSLSWQPPDRKSKGKSNWGQKIINLVISKLWRNRWMQEGSEVIGRNNLSVVRFRWGTDKTVIQETYWYPSWDELDTVKSRYEVSLEAESLPSLAK